MSHRFPTKKSFTVYKIATLLTNINKALHEILYACFLAVSKKINAVVKISVFIILFIILMTVLVLFIYFFIFSKRPKSPYVLFHQNSENIFNISQNMNVFKQTMW